MWEYVDGWRQGFNPLLLFVLVNHVYRRSWISMLRNLFISLVIIESVSMLHLQQRVGRRHRKLWYWKGVLLNLFISLHPPLGVFLHLYACVRLFNYLPCSNSLCHILSASQHVKRGCKFTRAILRLQHPSRRLSAAAAAADARVWHRSAGDQADLCCYSGRLRRFRPRSGQRMFVTDLKLGTASSGLLKRRNGGHVSFNWRPVPACR